MRRAAVAALLVAAAAALAPSGAADRGLIVGATEDAFLWRPTASAAVARDLGLQAIRVSLAWAPGQAALTPAQIDRLDALVPATVGLRVVVTLFGPARAAPVDQGSRDDFCATARDLLVRYPAIGDVVVWNEANLGFFWQPQFAADGSSAAPAAYEALLARCWDVLHAVRPDAHVVLTTSPSGNDNPAAASNVSHSPITFVRKLGAAYRASGRTRPIFDVVGHNPYGLSSAEPPWQAHLGPAHVGQGDTDRLMQTFRDAFVGTRQPVPGAIPIWFLEAGYQTIPDPAHVGAYTGRENDDRPLADPAAQSRQLTAGIELAYCQPGVGAYFNFLLWDEPDLARWQSGVLWADGGRKPAYEALGSVIADVRAGHVDCARVGGLGATTAGAAANGLVTRVEWPSLRAFSVYNVDWRIAVEAHADASYRARIFRAGRPAQLEARGLLHADRPKQLAFPAQTLLPGTYRIAVTVTRARRPRVTVTRTSPTFVVVR